MHKSIVPVLLAFAALALGDNTARAAEVHHFDLSMEHGCAANDCGVVWCWGGEEFVFGGDKGVKFSGTPSWPYQVGAGDRHSCVNVRDVQAAGGFGNLGMIDCWGRNDHGQIDVPQEQQWRQLAVGRDHNCATNSSNRALCWGRDDFGQVSQAPPTERFATLSAGHTQTCGVSRQAGNLDGAWVRCWGKTAGDVEVVSAQELAYPGLGERFAKVSAGGSHTCALSTANEVYCWGSNAASQLSPLFKGTPIGIVTQLENGTEMHWIPGNFVFIDVAAGELSTCAVYDDFVANERGVLCWGYPFSYETVWSAATNGALNAHELPLEGFEPETVDVTYNEVCALDTDTGELRCWTLHNTTTPWACDPATDANCCDDLQAPCCNPASEPACCDPSVDPYCSDHRSWGLFPEVDMYACL